MTGNFPPSLNGFPNYLELLLNPTFQTALCTATLAGLAGMKRVGRTSKAYTVKVNGNVMVLDSLFIFQTDLVIDNIHTSLR